MPELPEVETIVRDFRRQGVEGRTILRACVQWPRTVAVISPRVFARQIAGQRIDKIRRRAKYLVFEFSSGLVLLVHLRMTGHFQIANAHTPHTAHERLELELDDGRLVRFQDSRKFGRWMLTREPGSILNKLGPEPLEKSFSGDDLSARLKRHRRQLKPLLLDQTFLAGVGNIYADEALWEARLHPQRLSHTLSVREAFGLHKAIRLVLRRGIVNSGTSLGSGRANFHSVGGRPGRNQDGLKVFRKTGKPCPRCGMRIQRIVVAQRGTHICPGCQSLETSPAQTFLASRRLAQISSARLNGTAS